MARPAEPEKPVSQRSRSARGATNSPWCSSVRGIMNPSRFAIFILDRRATNRCPLGLTSRFVADSSWICTFSALSCLRSAPSGYGVMSSSQDSSCVALPTTPEIRSRMPSMLIFIPAWERAILSALSPIYFVLFVNMNSNPKSDLA